jgi:uncharacterized membrane protein
MNTPAEPHTSALRREWDHLAARERRIVEAVLRRTPVARDTNQAFMDERTFGQRMADRIAGFGGSWPFILLFLAFLAGWMALNEMILKPRGEQFDPFPFILLNLILSTLAALQAPVIMMSQNRQAERDRMNAANDYEVNLKAEMEIRALGERLESLHEAEWSELVRMQQRQIQLLERLLAGRSTPGDDAEDGRARP